MQISETPSESLERPALLRSLCILSFIMCGAMILIDSNNVIDSFRPYTDEELKGMEVFGVDPSLLTKNPPREMASLLCQLFSLTGVILMWKMRRQGFYIYLTAELLMYVVPFFFGNISSGSFTSSIPPAFTILIYILAVLAVVVDIGFIVAYAVLLKYMR